MRTKTFLFLPLALATMLGACSNESQLEGEDIVANGRKGKVTFDLTSAVEFTTNTRTVDENAYRTFDNYNVEITDGQGNSKFSGTFATLKNRLPMELDLGSYNITASYGTEYAASRDNFLATGSSTFSIQAGATVSATVNCTPTAGKVLVTFDPSMATYYDTYSVDFTGTAALGSSVAHWGKEDSAPYYLKLDKAGETVTYTLYLTAKSDYATNQNGEKKTEATATGSFQLKRNTTKKLTVKPNYTPTTDGGLSITIDIDDSTNDIPINIEVPVTWI